MSQYLQMVQIFSAPSHMIHGPKDVLMGQHLQNVTHVGLDLQNVTHVGLDLQYETDVSRQLMSDDFFSQLNRLLLTTL